MQISVKSKAKKINKTYKHSPTRIHYHPSQQQSRYNSQNMKKVVAEEERLEQQKRNKIEMSNLRLFFWKTADNNPDYPSSFGLIKPHPHLDFCQVSSTHLQTIGFPVLSYHIKQLINFAVIILEGNGFARRSLPQACLSSLITSIAGHYNAISYHNFSHAFNLMLINYQCIQKSPNLKQLYTEEEYCYIMIAAISHDLGHKGTNNQFEVKCQSNLAKMSGNQSVLQNMHIRTLWKIIQEDQQIDFLKTSTDIQQARHIITRLILSTDMAFHFSGLQNLKNIKKNGLVLDSTSDHKWTVMEQIFHASDIGNPCLDYDNYITWSALLTYEFNEQAKLQHHLGLEVTQSFVYKNINSLYSDQEWFLGTIVHPLWKEIADIFPDLNVFCDNISTNLKKIKMQTQTAQEQ